MNTKSQLGIHHKFAKVNRFVVCHDEMKDFVPYKKRLVKAVYLIICSLIRKKLEALNANSKAKKHLEFRLGYNLFFAGDFLESIKLLNMACNDEDTRLAANTSSNINSALTRNSMVHQITGRCCVQLYLASKSHHHLENAYTHYNNAIETMPVGLATMFKLPVLLLEFGRVLEYYGAFEAATDIYSRVLTNFPNFRGYFDAMYRMGIIFRHLASLVKDVEKKTDLLNKCTDILQFLLEALPDNISDVQIVFLYARALEVSSNPQIKYRAQSVYYTLFDICKRRDYADALNFKDSKPWLETSLTWYKLGELFVASGEELIAKDAFQKFVEEKLRRLAVGKDLASALDVNMCLTIAKNHADYQHFDEAVRFLDIGLQIDPYHREVRALLEKWSKAHVKRFKKEKLAIRSIIDTWKGRCWTAGFRRKLKEDMINSMEAQLQGNRYDKTARKNLAYYAKDKWRAKFLFEEHCVIRIQRKFRERRKLWIWQDAQRKHYADKASDLLRKYQRFPWNKEIRQSVVELMNHRLAPVKHPLMEVKNLIVKQNTAVRSLERSTAAYFSRRAIAVRIAIRFAKHHEHLCVNACVIQCMVRRFLARAHLRRAYQRFHQRICAARVIQRYVRWRNATFQHAVTTVVKKQVQYEKLRAKALRTLKLQFTKYVVGRRDRKKLSKSRQEQKRMLMLSGERMVQLAHLRQHAAVVIQRFWHNSKANFWSKVFRRVVLFRKHALYSLPTNILLSRLLNDPASQCRIPAVKVLAPAFNAMLAQQTVVCREDSFSASDCVMSCMVLRNKFCSIQQIILFNITDGLNPCFEFDFINALIKCISIRSLYIIEGTWSESFINNIVNVVQIENPRIIELGIERLHNAGKFCDTLSVSSGRLLMDYFNYSIPGLQTLSLHGCFLRDNMLDLMLRGLQVNSSLQSFSLSLNLITDEGFLEILKSINMNKKMKLQRLDLSWNLIQCGKAVKAQLLQFTPPWKGHYLEIYLVHNMIHQDPLTVQERFHLAQLSVIFQDADISPMERACLHGMKDCIADGTVFGKHGYVHHEDAHSTKVIQSKLFGPGTKFEIKKKLPKKLFDVSK